jgi:hypothetical protein
MVLVVRLAKNNGFLGVYANSEIILHDIYNILTQLYWIT